MLWLHPTEVRLGGRALDDVRAIALDERATRLALEHSDLGPHVVFVDAPERRTTLRVVRGADAAAGFDSAAFAPGDQATLSFRTTAGASDAQGFRVSADVVVTGVEHEWDERRGATQTITLEAVSTDGAAGPVSRTEAD